MSQHVPICVVQTLRPVRISTESIIDYLWRKPTFVEGANGEALRQSVNLREREPRISILAPPMTSSVIVGKMLGWFISCVNFTGPQVGQR